MEASESGGFATKIRQSISPRVEQLKTKFLSFRKPKQPTQEQSPVPQEIDTDSPDSRLRRVINQNNLEAHLEETVGLGFEQRLQAIRGALFVGIPHVRGQDPVQMRTAELNRGKGLSSVNYTSSRLVSTEFVPQLDRALNQLMEEIGKFDETSKGDAAIRLVSVIYTLGIPLHPYLDGNGQTLRMVALSYLKELAPAEFGERYFPFKPNNNGDNLAGNLTTPIISRLYHRNATGIFSAEALKKEWALRAGWIADNSPERAHRATEEEMKEMFPDEHSKAVLREFFQAGHQLIEKNSPRLQGNHPSQTNINFFLAYMLNSPEGKEFVRDFVLHPEKLDDRDEKDVPIYKVKAKEMFSGIGNEVRRLLESKEDHQGKFEEAKRLALEQPHLV